MNLNLGSEKKIRKLFYYIYTIHFINGFDGVYFSFLE